MIRPLTVLIFFVLFSCSKEERLEEPSSPVAVDRQSVAQHRSFNREIYIPDTSGLAFMPKRIKSISGDFDGDGIEEQLTEHYFNPKTGKKLRTVPVDGNNDWCALENPFTWLVCDSDRITPLHVSEGGWGLLTLLNLGDNNLDSLDEVAVVRDNNDYSSVTSCSIYQYCNGTWKYIFSFGVSEMAYYYPDDFDTSIFYLEIPGFLEKKRGRWRYLDHYAAWSDESDKFLDADGNVKLAPLKYDERCH